MLQKQPILEMADPTALEKRMNLVTMFESVHSAVITTSNIKTSLRLYNMIKSLVQTIDNTKQMRTYHSVLDIIWPAISKFCLSQSVLI